MQDELVKVARRIAQVAVDSEEAITEIYLFPDDKEIRLVELDPTMIPSGERIAPFYFPPDPTGDIPYPAGIALIRPEEMGRIPLPVEWGDWSQAMLLYKKDLAA